MPRTLTELTTEALGLPAESRAFLAEKLLETLDCNEDFPITDTWIAEAKSRCRQLDENPAQSVAAEDVFRDARNALA